MKDEGLSKASFILHPSSRRRRSHPASCDVVALGLVPYAEALALQRRRNEARF